MDVRNDPAALVAAMRVSNRPAHHLAADLETLQSAELVLERELSAQDEQLNLGREAGSLLRQAEVDLAMWRHAGIRMLSVLDAEYPPSLRAVHDRPPAIFLGGQLQPADGRGVAVIGTRHPTARGARLAGVISTHLQAMEYVVISGLAQGIDTAAHDAALRGGGRTVAVIGTGLHHVHPPQNASLQREIALGGAVISRLWPDTEPNRRTFPQRNALMSGIALASVIVEAGPLSGTRSQARAALAHNRPVFLWEGVLEQDWARELARHPGVHVIGSPEQLTDALARRYPVPSRRSRGELAAKRR